MHPRPGTLMISIAFLGTLLGFLASRVSMVAEEDTADQQVLKKKLVKLQPFIGAWKGVGQPQRGSSKDAWIEEADWQWDFADKDVAVTFSTPKGKYMTAARITSGDEEHTFRLTANPRDKPEDAVQYEGKSNEEDELIFEITEHRDDMPDRISIRTVANGDRLIVYLERRRGTTDRFSRLAEIGYTKKGSGFGKGTTYVECVITGGLGTIPVVHEGKTYYVCCTGCRDLFLADPEKALAEYRQRKEEEKNEKSE